MSPPADNRFLPDVLNYSWPPPSVRPPMTIPTAAFQRYVDRAREGRTALWRMLLGAVLSVVLLYAAAFAAGVIAAIIIARGLPPGGQPSSAQFMRALDAFLSTPAGGVFQLAAVAPGLGIVWLLLHLLHRRRFSGVLGAEGRLSRRDFGRALAATLIVGFVGEVPMLLIDPSLRRGPVTLDTWLLWLLPFAAVILAQIAAEEVVFRGYLLQSLAARFRSPLAWAVLPSVVFTLLHWDGGATAMMNAVILASIAIFALSTVLLVWLTGNLGAAMGLHFGMNVGAILLVSRQPGFGGLALFEARPLQSPDWTAGDAIGTVLISVVTTALTLGLLIHSRSPLSVMPTSPRPDATAEPLSDAPTPV